MTTLKPLVAASLLAAPLIAATPALATAPSGGPDTRYCMKVEPVTGSRVERTLCMTRAEWEQQGVDLDAEWPSEGVRVEN